MTNIMKTQKSVITSPKVENTETKTDSYLLNSEIFTPNELCAFLKIDPSTRRRWERSGKIKSKCIGGKRYYMKSYIIELLTPDNK